jgi:hypothetical protein
MRLRISNIKAIRDCDVTLSPKVTLFGGQNEVGKSTVALALGAALHGEILKYFGVTRNSNADKKQLVNDAAVDGYVKLSTPDGETTIEYPAGKMSQRGPTPWSSIHVAGAVPPAEITAAELQRYINADPTREEFDKEFEGIDAPVAEIWESIQRRGWDATHERAVDKRKELKGAWRHLTGEDYGATKQYMPDDFVDRSVEELTAELQRAEESYTEAVVIKRISADERAQLAEIAATYDGLVESLPALQDEQLKHAAQVKNLETELAKIKVPAEEKTVACPECSAPVVISGNALKKPSAKSTKKSREEITAKVDAIRKNLDSLIALRDDASAKFMALSAKARAAENAARQLESVSDATDAVNADEIRDHIATIRRQIDAVKRKQEVESITRQLAMNQYICDATSPEGLRRQKMMASRESFNKTLEQMSTVAGWGTVALDEYLQPTLRGRGYKFLSKSAQFRVNVTLALAFAQIDKSQVVIIDAADINDRQRRGQLFELLNRFSIPVVVTMTYNSIDEMPDLASYGLGVSYWIEAGVVSAAGKAVAA